jgi:hypothetical protein
LISTQKKSKNIKKINFKKIVLKSIVRPCPGVFNPSSTFAFKYFFKSFFNLKILNLYMFLVFFNNFNVLKLKIKKIF